MQAIQIAFKSIPGSKIRSFLTMPGIIIGVIAVVVLDTLSTATATLTMMLGGIAAIFSAGSRVLLAHRRGIRTLSG